LGLDTLAVQVEFSRLYNQQFAALKSGEHLNVGS
jgi:hypothetical protein